MQIQIENLSHTFRNGHGKPLVALEEIELEIASGALIAVIGPSGCGKSTLLRILSGLLRPSQGQVRLGQAPVSQVVAAKRIGWLAQNPALLPWKTVAQNISLAQQINPRHQQPGLPTQRLLELVGLAEFSQAYPFSLSGGMQQRVALARTLALNAELWLMDEPFAALDELTRELLTGELLQLWQGFPQIQPPAASPAPHSPPTILWVTHQIYEAVRLADRVLVMSARPGRIIADVRIDLPRPRQDHLAEFQQIVLELRSQLHGTLPPAVAGGLAAAGVQA